MVDGPSTDETDEFLSEMEAKGQLETIHQSKLAGISSARNLGWKAAKRRIHMFCG